MIPELNINEKFAIIFVLSEIMKADGVIHPNEEEYIDRIYTALGVTVNDLDSIINMDSLHSKYIIDEMSSEKKKYVQSLFIEMAECDGYVHPKEIKLINDILH